MSNSGQQRSFLRGRQCLEQGDSLSALAFFEAAIRQAMKAGEPPRPRDLSYYGLCLALGTRHRSEAEETCRRAMEMEFYNPDLCFNLGTVYMLGGDRAAAFDAFLSGLRLQSDHPGIRRAVRRMGIRRQLAIPFLSRSNPVNRILGRLTPR